MRKNSKIGAFALALALTVALITPVTANADVIEEYHRDAAGDITSTTYRNEDTGASYELTSYNMYKKLSKECNNQRGLTV